VRKEFVQAFMRLGEHFEIRLGILFVGQDLFEKSRRAGFSGQTEKSRNKNNSFKQRAGFQNTK